MHIRSHIRPTYLAVQLWVSPQTHSRSHIYTKDRTRTRLPSRQIIDMMVLCDHHCSRHGVRRRLCVPRTRSRVGGRHGVMLSGCMRACWQNSLQTLAIGRNRLAAYSPCDWQKSRRIWSHSSLGSSGQKTALGGACLTNTQGVPSQARLRLFPA